LNENNFTLDVERSKIATYICPINNDNNSKINIMTKQAIISANPQGQMTMVSGTNDIVFSNGVVLTSATSREKETLWNKLTRMGYEQVTNTSSDEFDGLVQAAQIGENPFECTIMCANPELNEVAGAKVLTNDDFMELIDIRSSKYEENLERYGDRDCTCIVCGKPTNQSLYIECTTDMWIAPADITEEQLTALDMESQGCFPIGSDCAKKVGKRYLIVQ
jgi:hypothetical protein